MPPIEVGSAQGIRAIDARLARQTAPSPEPAPANVASVPVRPVAMSEALDPGAAPVDMERVQMIRRAIETDTYPVVPARIADAIIAAGIMLRTGK